MDDKQKVKEQTLAHIGIVAGLLHEVKVDKNKDDEGVASHNTLREGMEVIGNIWENP